MTYTQIQDTVYLCKDNFYSVDIVFQGHQNPSLVLSATSSLDCSQPSFCNLPAIESIEIVSGNVPPFTQAGNGSWELNGLLNNTNYSFTYKVRLDCNAIRNCHSLDSTGGTFNQGWKINGISIPSSGGINQSTPVLLPFLVEILKPALYGNYGDEVPMIHEYRNTGKGPAEIFFQFTPFDESLCTGDSILAMHYVVGDWGLSNGTLNFAQNLSSGSWYKVTVPTNKSLYVRKLLRITGCLTGNPCANQADVFTWRCDTIATGCPSCQQIYAQKIPLKLTEDQPRFEIQIQSPIDPMQDFSCFGSSIPYEIYFVNQGPVNMPFATIKFYLTPQGVNQLGLIDSTSFSVTPVFQNSYSNLSRSPFSFLPGALCSASVPKPLSAVYLYVKDFMIGDTIKLNYDLFKCCASDDTLYNKGLAFNHWALDSWVGRSCKDSVALHYNHWIGNTAGWNTQLDYDPAVFDITVPQGAIFGPSTGIMFMDVSSPVSCSPHNTIFGCSSLSCNTQSCIRKGYLRVRFDLDTGLIMDSLVPFFESYFPPYANQWHPVYSQSNYTTGTCTASSTTFYFDLSDGNAYELLNKSRLFFEFKSCCTPPEPSTFYKISFDLLPQPSNGCDSTVFANGFPDLINLCWLPVAQVSDKINIRCPGCLAPGFEAISYDMKRITFGLEDQDNNGKADASLTPISQAYLNNHKYFIKTRAAQPLDVVQDFLTGDMIDGDSTGGGYTYQQILNDGGKFNSLQILRKVILENGKNSGLEPFWFRLYVDSLSMNDTLHCFECDPFSKSNNYFTVHVLEGDGSNMASFLEKDSLHMLFSFDVTHPTQPFFTDSVPTGYSGKFDGFKPHQRYRMTVKYKVCSDWGPITNECINQDASTKVSKSEILNYGFFSGKKQPIDSVHTFGAMYDLPFYNTVASIPPVYADYGQSFVDNSVFWCVRNSGRMRFYGREIRNTSTFRLGSTNTCQPFLWSRLISRTAGCDAPGLFPFEFRAPGWIGSGLDIQIPAGYSTGDSAYAYTYNWDPAGNNHDYWPDFDPNVPYRKVPVSITPASGQFLLDLDPVLSANNYGCITDNYNFFPPDSTRLFCSDNYFDLSIILPLYATDSCQAGRKILIGNSDVKGEFVPNLQACLPLSPPTVCNTGTIILPSMQTDTLSLPDAKPDLVFLPDSVRVISDKVCWKFNMENTVNSPGYFAFVAPPVASYLSNWSLISSNNTNINMTQGVFPLGTINGNSTLAGYTLCADYDSCAGSDSLQVYYGWDCSKYPARDSLHGVCFLDSTTIKFKEGIVNVQTGLSHPLSMGLCSPLTVSAQLYSMAEGHVAPLAFGISGHTNFTLNSITIFSCQDSLIQFTIPITGDSLWDVTGFADSLFTTHALNLGNCFTVKANLELACNMNLTAGDSVSLPEFSFYYSTFCNSDTLVTIAHRNIQPQPASVNYVSFNGNSSCTGCFSVTKTALQDTVEAGQSMQFQIQICGNNAGSDTAYVVDVIPSDFNLTSTIPAYIIIPKDTCLSIFVSGYFNTIGSCSDTIHRNIVHIYNSIGDTISDSACVTVVEPCSIGVDYVFADGYNISSTLVSQIDSSTIFVHGVLNIDMPFTFHNCTIYMAPAAQIVVKTVEFNLVKSLVTGCETMWKNIFLEQGSISFIDNSEIRDAEDGIYASDQSIVSTFSTRYINCIRGIYVPPNLNNTINNIVITSSGNYFSTDSVGFKVDYVGQAPHGSIGFAGVEVNDIIGNIGVKSVGLPNFFYKLNMGIYAKNSNLVIENNRFVNIFKDSSSNVSFGGYAIAGFGDSINYKPSTLWIRGTSTSNPEIFACENGIFKRYSNLEVQNMRIIDVSTGINASRITNNSSVKITDNQINVYKTGIGIWDNPGKKNILIYNNSIITEGDKKSVGIYLSDFLPSGLVKNPYSILNNYIVIKQAGRGILSQGIRKSDVTGNSISATNTNSNVVREGISLEGCDRSLISCNTVYGRTPNDTLFYGFAVKNSTANTISCNTVDSTGRGYFFGGISPSTFRGNTMRNHFVGLYLNKTAVIDTQSHAGNRWLGTYGSSFGAINMNDSLTFNLYSSLFVVDPSLTYLTPTTPTASPNNSGWFDIGSSATYSCSSQQVCNSNDRIGILSEELRQAILQDLVLTSEFIPESQYMARRMLYEDLMQDSLLSSLPDFQAWLSEQNGSSVEHLIAVENLLAQIFDMEINTRAEIEEADSILSILFSAVLQADSMAQGTMDATYMNQRTELLDLIKFQLGIVSDLLAREYGDISQEWVAVAAENSETEPLQLADQNEQYLNSILISYYQQGVSSIASSYSGLFSLANQCPYQGGKSVFIARALLRLVNDSLTYDDFAVCLAAGIYRIHNSSEPSNSLLKIQPNPAKDNIDLIIPNIERAIFEMEINDVLGKRIKIEELSFIAGKSTVSTEVLLPGVYFLKLNDHYGTIYSGKLIIVE